MSLNRLIDILHISGLKDARGIFMINGKKCLVLIPARGGSKGLTGKNMIELCGLPLMGWPIQAAKKSKYVDELIVSTDDKEIAAKAVELGAKIPFIRPSELATDTASTASVVEHVLSFVMSKGTVFEYIILLEPTSPLTESEDIDKALEILESQREIADSIVGVSKVEAAHPMFDVTITKKGLLQPFYSNEFSTVKRRQDISDLYFFEGSLYISDSFVFLQKKTFYHNRTLPYIVQRWKAFEIDEVIDLICVEAIIKNLDKIKKSKE